MKNITWRIKQGTSILSEYKGSPPLATYLKEYFRSNKKFGRRDRSEISQVLFSYFRLGKLAQHFPIGQAIALGYYLANDCDENELTAINTLLESIELKKEDSIDRRLEIVEGLAANLNTSILPDFPLSLSIKPRDWTVDFLSQPDTFLRVVKEKSLILDDLEQNSISHLVLEDSSIKVPANTKLDDLPSAKQGCFYIQDYSSQRVVDFMNAEPNSYWWDACAGAGGKSLLFLSRNPGHRLMASDIRKSSLYNYRKRLQHHGFDPVSTEVLDLSKSLGQPKELLDGVILDVPCSGSGTWARSPEQAHYFKRSQLQQFVNTQRQIFDNAVTWLKPGGVLLYITCSVFKDENEHQIEHFCSQKKFTLEGQQMLTGFEHNADHLFVARLTSPND